MAWFRCGWGCISRSRVSKETARTLRFSIFLLTMGGAFAKIKQRVIFRALARQFLNILLSHMASFMPIAEVLQT